MNTPSPRYFCPECRTVYTTDQNFCSKCGADMKHVSGLAFAARGGSGSGSAMRPAPAGPALAERRTSRAIPATTEDPIGQGPTEELSDSWQPPERERRTAGKDPWLGTVVDGRYKVNEV